MNSFIYLYEKFLQYVRPPTVTQTRNVIINPAINLLYGLLSASNCPLMPEFADDVSKFTK